MGIPQSRSTTLVDVFPATAQADFPYRAESNAILPSKLGIPDISLRVGRTDFPHLRLSSTYATESALPGATPLGAVATRDDRRAARDRGGDARRCRWCGIEQLAITGMGTGMEEAPGWDDEA
jgi:hypothetical protein